MKVTWDSLLVSPLWFLCSPPAATQEKRETQKASNPLRSSLSYPEHQSGMTTRSDCLLPHFEGIPGSSHQPSSVTKHQDPIGPTGPYLRAKFAASEWEHNSHSQDQQDETEASEVSSPGKTSFGPGPGQ